MESYVDQREKCVVHRDDDYISREKVAERYRFLQFIFRGEKRTFLRRNSLFPSTKEFPNGRRRGAGLIGIQSSTWSSNKALETRRPP